MRITRVLSSVGTMIVCVVAAAPKPRATNVARASPVILEKDEGERRVVRGWPGHPEPGETFILKIDPKNGGSSHLVMLTATIPVGKKIDTHRHPEADEVLYLQAGTARVHLGDSVRVAHAGATVFIPAGTWISADNVGADAVELIAIFSRPRLRGLHARHIGPGRREKCSVIAGRRRGGREKAPSRRDLPINGAYSPR